MSPCLCAQPAAVHERLAKLKSEHEAFQAKIEEAKAGASAALEKGAYNKAASKGAEAARFAKEMQIVEKKIASCESELAGPAETAAEAQQVHHL